METLDREQVWKEVIQLFAELKTKEEVEILLNCFLTIEEKNDIVDRFRIIKSLLRGDKPQRQLSEELNVSIAKITRGSNMLKTVNKKTKEFLTAKI